jgi:hypothetical protein
VWTISLSGTPASNSEIIAGVSVNNWVDTSTSVTQQGSGWTELHDLTGAGPETHGQAQVATSPSSSVTWAEADASPGAAAAVAVEIRAGSIATRLGVSQVAGAASAADPLEVLKQQLLNALKQLQGM